MSHQRKTLFHKQTGHVSRITKHQKLQDTKHKIKKKSFFVYLYKCKIPVPFFIFFFIVFQTFP